MKQDFNILGFCLNINTTANTTENSLLWTFRLFAGAIVIAKSTLIQ